MLHLLLLALGLGGVSIIVVRRVYKNLKNHKEEQKKRRHRSRLMRSMTTGGLKTVKPEDFKTIGLDSLASTFRNSSAKTFLCAPEGHANLITDQSNLDVNVRTRTKFCQILEVGEHVLMEREYKGEDCIECGEIIEQTPFKMQEIGIYKRSNLKQYPGAKDYVMNPIRDDVKMCISCQGEMIKEVGIEEEVATELVATHI